MEAHAGVPGILEVLIALLALGFVAIGAVLTVIPFWKICSKAGFPGPLALLMAVPIANIILPFYIAFAEWPVLKQSGIPANRE